MKTQSKFSFLLLMVAIACITPLSAQITREQADVIVLQHIKKEVSTPYLLYVNLNSPSEAGISLTTHNKENMNVKYACWAYYLNEHLETSEPAQHRYLFVKENDGNLLEIITYSDLGPVDLIQWKLIPLGVNEMAKSDIRIFPNPTTGELTIDNGQLTIISVEIYDVTGKMQKRRKAEERNVVMNISDLSSGVYFLKIITETSIFSQKVIKN